MLKRQIHLRWNKFKMWWWRQKLVIDKPTYAPWCIKKRETKDCPVCLEPYFATRVVLGEDMAMVDDTSIHPTVCYAIVGREYLHRSSKYCSERLYDYVKLEEPELKTIRKAKSDGD